MSVESGGASRFAASLLSSLNSHKTRLQTLCRPVGHTLVIGFLPGSGDFNADGVNFDFPNAPSADFSGSNSRQEYLRGLFAAADFPLPAPGTLGNLPRHGFRGPGMVNVDFTVIKNNQLSERVNLQLRFEFFNILNRVNLRNVNGNLASSTFGRSTSTFPARQIQLGARIAF